MDSDKPAAQPHRAPLFTAEQMEAMFRFTFMTSRVSALAATRPASSRELNESIILAQQAEADLMSLFLHPNDRQHFPAAIQRAAQNSRIIP